MKIAACIKRVPDTEARLRLAKDGRWIDEEDVSFVTNESDNYALEEALQLADKTGGKYFNAKDTEALADVYAEIDQLEKTETEGRLYTEYREVFQGLMLPGIVCVLLQLVLASTRFRGLP